MTDTTGINTVNAVSGGEYLIQGMNRDYVTEDEITHGDYVAVEDSKRNENRFHINVSNHAGKESYMTVPLFAYRGYRAVDVATGTELSVKRNDYGALQVILPAGYRGTVQIYFRERTIWRIGEAVSLVTLLTLAALSVRQMKRHG